MQETRKPVGEAEGGRRACLHTNSQRGVSNPPAVLLPVDDGIGAHDVGIGVQRQLERCCHSPGRAMAYSRLN